VIHGRVQGVFFRDTLRRQAESRGIAGWVRNKDDGTVEAVFEGDPDAVSEMRRIAGEGPERASVERLEESGEQPEGLEGFRIV
jgi:acylphosphatase